MREPDDDVVRVDGLALDEDLDFQQRSWRAQRVGQLAIVLFVLAALAGLFGGPGLASNAREDSGDGMQVRYPRFLRAHAPFDVAISLASTHARDGRFTVWIDQVLLEKYRVEQVTPEPAAQRLGRYRVVYEFETSGGTPPAIRLVLQARGGGWISGRIGASDTSVVTLQQLIFP